jgi:hypothetical protein
MVIVADDAVGDFDSDGAVVDAGVGFDAVAVAAAAAAAEDLTSH